MATYTMQLRKVIDYYGREEVENWFKNYELSDYLTQEQINQITSLNIWSKDKLASKIIDNYFMREIGFETPALFKHYAKIEMKKIMEDYLPVIYSNSIPFDPLVNVDYTESYTREIEGESANSGSSNSKSNNNSSGLNVNSDTPQGQISKQAILGGSYASQTNASETETEIEDETTTSNSGSSNTVETFTKNIKGNSGVSATAQALIKQYRDIIRAVDREIIEKLNNLFFGLY